MKLLAPFLLLMTGLAFTATAHADETQKITRALNAAMPSLKIDAIQPSGIAGLYEVMVGANILYTTADGKYVIQGHIFDTQAKKDLTESKLGKVRINALHKAAGQRLISFKAAQPKHDVYVFTDIDCGYCRKLHSEIDNYLAEGINIHYLFFPRAGKGSESYDKAVSVWCAKDRNKALTEAKQGKDPEPKTCDNPVDDHLALGMELGARGTPMLVTAKGSIFPGYMSAKQLAEALALEE